MAENILAAQLAQAKANRRYRQMIDAAYGCGICAIDHRCHCPRLALWCADCRPYAAMPLIREVS